VGRNKTGITKKDVGIAKSETTSYTWGFGSEVGWLSTAFLEYPVHPRSELVTLSQFRDGYILGLKRRTYGFDPDEKRELAKLAYKFCEEAQIARGIE
jgi:hypothetical protein